MDTATVQTGEQLLAEGLRHFGLNPKDVERFSPRVWSVAEGVLTIKTVLGPLKFRTGDGEKVFCAEGHENFAWYRGCKQCMEKQKRGVTVAVQEVARDFLSRLDLARRKLRIEAARTGAAPGPRKWTEGGPSWS